MPDPLFEKTVYTASRDKITISVIPKSAVFDLPRVVLDTHQDVVLVLSLREVLEIAHTLGDAVDAAIEM